MRDRAVRGGRISDPALRELCEGISSGASGRDRSPGFPEEPFRLLAEAGVLGMPVCGEGNPASFSEEWRVLRGVAGADGSVCRILDGHLNAVERVALLAPEPLRSEEMEAISAGHLRLGVWGADPIPGEGNPARIVRDGGETRLAGVKTFCSGAGGLDRALVAVRGEDDEDGAPGPPRLVYVDLSEGVAVDRVWYRSSGMRSSESHRVVFDGARVLAVLGEPGEIVREPYFSRDAVRTAVTWAGISDLARESALDILAAKSGGEPDDISSLTAGRLLSHAATIDRWMEDAARLADEEPVRLAGAYAVSLRQSVASACRSILDEAARAVGSHPFATAGPLDRAKRDLELILLQHRLEPALAKTGRAEISSRTRRDGR